MKAAENPEVIAQLVAALIIDGKTQGAHLSNERFVERAIAMAHTIDAMIDRGNLPIADDIASIKLPPLAARFVSDGASAVISPRQVRGPVYEFDAVLSVTMLAVHEVGVRPLLERAFAGVLDEYIRRNAEAVRR